MTDLQAALDRWDEEPQTRVTDDDLHTRPHSDREYKRHNQMMDFVCLECGVVVSDSELHDEWHRDMARVALLAAGRAG